MMQRKLLVLSERGERLHLSDEKRWVMWACLGLKLADSVKCVQLKGVALADKGFVILVFLVLVGFGDR